ncbi:MAG: CvpA family protein [Bryobacteraceae bacterium]|nr:CvpA family protein [Bryobacteraceae bacterium]
MNWLDILLGGVIAISVITGVMKGFARLGIGIAAAVAGIVLGVWFYGTAGSLFTPIVSSRPLANLLGFLAVLASALIAGSLLGWIVSKLFKAAGLGWLDRAVGGAFGFVRGLLIAIALLMAIMAFTPGPPPSAVVQSRLSPYVIEAASVLAAIAPRELRDGFAASYDHVKKTWSKMLRKGVQRLPTHQI